MKYNDDKIRIRDTLNEILHLSRATLMNPFIISSPIRILCFDKDQRIRTRYETMKRDYEIPNRRPILIWQTYLIWRTCFELATATCLSYLTCYDDALTKAFRKLSIDLTESVS